jgi:DNA invertase Pin-like site-specific DNA recombinase
MSTTTPLRTALYLRISEDPDDRQAGVERQQTDCRAYAARMGWTVVDTFVDNDIPAYGGKGSRKQRMDYHRLIDAVRQRSFDVVVGYHSSRWHRDVEEYFEFVKLLKSTGIAWHTAMEGEIRFSSATDEATSTMRAVFNQLESALKSERIKRQKLDAAVAGQFNGGIRCFGYERDGMTVRESEAAQIRRVAEAVLAGQSLRSLAKELNQRGVKTVTGKGPWTSSHLRKMLLRPRLTGLRIHNGDEYQGAWPAVLTRETWEAVKAVLTDPKRNTNSTGVRGPIPTVLGSGIYICGVCGQPRMRRAVANGGQRVYRCGNYIDNIGGVGHVCRVADKLDEFVTGALLYKLSEPGVIEALCNVVDTDDIDMDALRAERDDIRKELLALAAKCDVGDIDAEQLGIASRRKKQRDKEITATLTAVSTRSPLHVLLGADNVERVWDDVLTLGQQRAILAEVLTVTVLPRRGGRGPDGSYFDPDGVRIGLTERAAAALEDGNG